MSQRWCSRVKTSWTTSSPVAWSPTMNAASFTSPGRCTRYASAKPDPADDAGRSAVSSGVYRSAPGLMSTTLHAPLIGCLRPLSTILRSPVWGANTPEGGIGVSGGWGDVSRDGRREHADYRYRGADH